MSTSNTDLLALQKRVRQWQELKDREAGVQQKIATMERLLPQLKAEAEREQDDVDHLENGGIVSMFYSAIGRHEEKLDKERQEARAASVKYQDALRTCQSLYRELEDVRAQMDTLRGCVEQYRSALQEKQQRLLQGTDSSSAQFRALTQRAEQCSRLNKEIIEALDAGESVLSQLSAIEDTLKSASNWGVVDMVGGGFLSDMAKYGRLDEAQQQMNELSRLLAMYSKELKDLDVDLNLSANIGSGMQFADFFFDGFIADSMALSRINRLRDQVADIRRQVQYYRDMLVQRQKQNDETLRQLKQQAEDLLIHI